MKKLSTLCIFLLSTLFVSAQNFVFTNNETVLEDGATVTLGAHELIDEEDPAWSEVMGATNHEGAEDQLFLKNTSSSEQEIEVTVTTESFENTKDSYQWCMGFGQMGVCQIFTDQITKSGSIPANLSSQLDLDAYFTFGESGNVKFKVTVKQGSSTLRTLYVKMVYSPTGIHSIANNAFHRVADNNLYYKFEETGRHSIQIYNITGKLIKNVEVTTEGTLSLAELQKGIYIYAIKTNDKQIVAQKCVIK